jgi:purine-cytosine permease-like protein
VNHPHIELPDREQTAWQLAVIQLSGWTSLPILATSIILLEKNSFLGAALTIIVGNALLWFLRLGIIAMSFAKKQSTLDIAREYLGEAGNYSIAILLLGATLVWFTAQTATASSSITQLLAINENAEIDQFSQVSVLMGLISTLFCMGGMVVLRKLSTISFPILVLLFFAIVFSLPNLPTSQTAMPLSLSGLTLVLSTNLGTTADLPTFFRHSQSWRASLIGLTWIQLISIFLGICSLYLGAVLQSGFQINQGAIISSGSALLRFSLIGFVFISTLCANVSNVYSASVGWELIAPKALVGRKEYFILGLMLTTIFILVSGGGGIEVQWLQICDNALVNLCLVLIGGFIISRRVGKLPNLFEQLTYFAAWLIASVINSLQVIGWALADFSTVLVGAIVISVPLLIRLIVKR